MQTMKPQTILDLDNEYLVLKKAPSDVLIEAIDSHEPNIAGLRNVLIAAIREGVVTGTRQSEYGQNVMILTTIKRPCFHVECWIQLTRSTKTAPDGKKRITFFSGFYVRKVSDIARVGA